MSVLVLLDDLGEHPWHVGGGDWTSAIHQYGTDTQVAQVYATDGTLAADLAAAIVLATSTFSQTRAALRGFLIQWDDLGRDEAVPRKPVEALRAALALMEQSTT